MADNYDGYFDLNIENIFKEYTKDIIPERNLSFFRRHSFPFKEADYDGLALISCQIPVDIAGGSHQNHKTGKYYVPVKVSDYMIFADSLIRPFLEGWNFGTEDFTSYFFKKCYEVGEVAEKTLTAITKIGEVALNKNYQFNNGDNFEILLKDTNFHSIYKSLDREILRVDSESICKVII